MRARVCVCVCVCVCVFLRKQVLVVCALHVVPPPDPLLAPNLTFVCSYLLQVPATIPCIPPEALVGIDNRVRIYFGQNMFALVSNASCPTTTTTTMTTATTTTTAPSPCQVRVIGADIQFDCAFSFLQAFPNPVPSATTTLCVNMCVGMVV
jgi:hypothetical protein